MKKDFSYKKDEISFWLRKIFGFKLPIKLDIVLDYFERKGIHGTSIISNPPLIALQLNKYRKSCVTIVLHELLHSLIREHRLLRTKKFQQRYFEEALLDYFVPYGILDEKIGLIKYLDIEKHQIEQDRLRPYASNESRRLLPLIKEYYKICGKETIWSFLKEKGILYHQ